MNGKLNANPTPPRRRVLLLSLLGLLALLVFLAARLPARLMLAHALQDLPGLTVGSVSGTVWEGRARGLRYRELEVPALAWELDFWPLLGGTAALRIEAELPRGFARLDAALGLDGRIELENLRATLPLDSLAALYPAIPAGTVSGELTLNLDSARLEGLRPVALSGDVGLTGLTSSWTGALPLGDYMAEISAPAEGEIQARIVDLQGPVKLQARATLGSDGRWQAEGTVAPRDGSDRTLARAMAYLGPANAAGEHRFSFSGRIQ